MKGNLGEIRRLYAIQRRSMGWRDKLPPLGPFPLRDTWGMAEAVTLLSRSIDSGKYQDHLQFGSWRKGRSALTNLYHVSPEGYTGMATMAKDDRKLHLTGSPTYGLWFERFMAGAHARVGEEVRQDFGTSVHVVHALLRITEEDYCEARDKGDETTMIELEDMVSFFVNSYVASLRGEEVPLLELSGMLETWTETALHPTHPHMVLTMYGRFKGETGDAHHLVPVANKTRLGLRPRLWMGRKLDRLVKAGRRSGWVYARQDGSQGRIRDYDGLFKDYMCKVKERFPWLIPAKINPLDDMSLRRSGRRGSMGEAQNQKLDKTAIDFNNRWGQHMRGEGKQPHMKMRQHYAQIENMLPTLLRYSSVQ